MGGGAVGTAKARIIVTPPPAAEEWIDIDYISEAEARWGEPEPPKESLESEHRFIRAADGKSFAVKDMTTGQYFRETYRGKHHFTLACLSARYMDTVLAGAIVEQLERETGHSCFISIMEGRPPNREPWVSPRRCRALARIQHAQADRRIAIQRTRDAALIRNLNKLVPTTRIIAYQEVERRINPRINIRLLLILSLTSMAVYIVSQLLQGISHVVSHVR